MKKRIQILSLGLFIVITLGTVALLFLTNTINFPLSVKSIILWALFGILFILLCNEGIYWIKNGKRTESADLIAIFFIGITVYLITEDVLTSIMGAFSIYLLFGLYELKDYEILNKIILISVITYNIIFIGGLLDRILGLNADAGDTTIQNILFPLSFFIILILGFIIFGRKYMVVFRFLSAQYLTLVFYLIAWLAISIFWKITQIDLSDEIYYIIIALNFLIYLFSGILLDWMMGYKKTENSELNELVAEVAREMGMNPDRIKVRFGKYPILNAMAYGCVGLDMHMAIIAPELQFGKGGIDKDEIRGVIAHELGHLRGMHTLILNLAGSLQIFIYKLLDWPATMFDYTFEPDQQPFPLWVFMLINFGITIFLYIFVRMLEGRSDLAACKAGYEQDLAKGLYNLESFYATSHEVGLDATLLSDEEISEQNRMLNYIATSQYLNQNMIKPGKGTLLSNLINAHPPSYHRILSILKENHLNTAREALLPFTLLSKKKARSFAIETNSARVKFNSLSTTKIKKEFDIDNLIPIYERIGKKDNLTHLIGKEYAFRNWFTGNIFRGIIRKLEYSDEGPTPIKFKIELTSSSLIEQNNQENFKIIDPQHYKFVIIGQNMKYYFHKKEKIYELKEVDLETLYFKKQEKAKKKVSDYYLFKNRGVFKFKATNSDETLTKAIFNTKLPRPLETLADFESKTVYIKKKGTLYPFYIENFNLKDNYQKIYFEVKSAYEQNEEDSPKKLDFNTYYTHIRNIFIPLHADDNTIENELKLLQFYQTNNTKILLILKKAVNSEILGYIKEIKIPESDDKKKAETIIVFKSVFKEKYEMALNKIDSLYINQPSLIFEKKSNVSSLTRLFYKLKRKNHPDQIYY